MQGRTQQIMHASPERTLVQLIEKLLRHMLGKLHSNKQIWSVRTKLLLMLLEAGYDVILTDTDAVWLHRPFRWLNHGTSP